MYIDTFRQGCQLSIQKLVCSLVYKKCENDGNISDASSWSNVIYDDINMSMPLPYQRPCRSICTEAIANCFDATKILGIELDCDDKYTYTLTGMTDESISNHKWRDIH
jgi:hypothetical protein